MFAVLKGPGLLRLGLALMVFAHHMSRVAIGQAAVFVFFVLSGYWIAKMWRVRYSQARQPYVTYLVSRLWRLLPVFLLVSGLMLVWNPGSDSFDLDLRFWVSQLGLLGYAQLPQLPLIPAWSLDIELQFYLVAPVVIALAGRHPATALVLSIALAVACAMVGAPAVLPKYLVFFIVGVAAADRAMPSSASLATWSTLAVVLALAALAASPWRHVLIGGSGPTRELNRALNVAVAVGLTPFALFTVTQRGGRFDPMAADLSYIVYLLHWPITMWIGHSAAGHLPLLRRLPFAAAGVAVTLAASFVIWAAYDRPINRLRAKWVAGRLRSTGLLPAGSQVAPAAPRA